MLPLCHSQEMGLVRDYLEGFICESERFREIELLRGTETRENLRRRRRASIVTMRIYP